MLNVDVVILSWAKSQYHIDLTINTIDSLIKSETDIKFNVYLIENSDYQWNQLKDVTITNLIEPFNYNKFMNLGATMGMSDYIIFANNDLEFTPGFMSEMLIYNFDVMSPKSATTSSQFRLETCEGYKTSKHVSGWCFCMKREVWNKIGGLDEEFIGWFADDSMIMQILEAGYKHYHISESIVNHLDNGSNTLNTLEGATNKKYTVDLINRFNTKYLRNKFGKNPEYEINELKFR
jgi:hypothetical protein